MNTKESQSNERRVTMSGLNQDEISMMLKFMEQCGWNVKYVNRYGVSFGGGSFEFVFERVNI